MGLCAVILITAAVLMGHKGHLFSVLPYLFILLCPLMHLFMHGKHNTSGAEGEDTKHDQHHNSSL